jgi:hypothetical protein
MMVKVNFKSTVQFLIAIILPVLLITTFLPKTTFASQVGTDGFTIEAGQIQGVMLPPKIVFVDTDTAHRRPAVEFRYQEATITGMTLYKQLDTGRGPMLVKIKSSEPIHVTNLTVTATSFTFTGACLDFSNPTQALVMKNVTMQATEMTSDSMTSNGLTLATQKGTLPSQSQAIPGFLQSIMNENSFSAQKLKASEIEAANLLMCPAGSQGDTSTSNKKTGVLPTVSDPTKLVKQVGGVDPTPITKLVPTPSGLVTKTEPFLKTVKKQVSSINPTGLTKTVKQVVKKVTDTSTVTNTVTSTVNKTADQLKLEKELNQLQSDFNSAQKATDQLTSQIGTLSKGISDSQGMFNDISNVLSNPFNIGRVGEEILALGQLNNQLNPFQSQLGELKAAESKEQQAYLDIKKRAQDLGSTINTEDLKTPLDKNQAQLTSLTKQLSTLTNGVQSLLDQFS